MKKLIGEAIVNGIYLTILTPICTAGLFTGVWLFSNKIEPKLEKFFNKIGE